MDVSIYATPMSKHRRTQSTSDYTHNLDSAFSYSPSNVTNEKLKITFEKHFIQTEMQRINNRINKILAIEKEVAKKSRQEKQIAEDEKKKRDRNIRKHQELEEIKHGKLQKTLEFKVKINEERFRRKSCIKILEDEIVKEKKQIAKEIKKNEVKWNEINIQQKKQFLDDNAKKTQLVKSMLLEKKNQRCISQMNVREQYKLDYQRKVIKLKNEQELALKDLKDLENNYNIVLKQVSATLNQDNKNQILINI